MSTLNKQAWERMTDSATMQAAAIFDKSTDLGFNVEIAVKNGGAETVVQMITELESTLRVLKRRLNVSIKPQAELQQRPKRCWKAVAIPMQRSCQVPVKLELVKS